MGICMEEETRRGHGRSPKPQTLPVKLLKGYWPKRGGRHQAGEEIELPIDEARSVVKLGIAVRNDEF